MEVVAVNGDGDGDDVVNFAIVFIPPWKMKQAHWHLAHTVHAHKHS